MRDDLPRHLKRAHSNPGRRFWGGVAAGAALGAFAGVGYLWVSLSRAGFFAALIAGAVVGAIIGGYSAIVEFASELGAGVVFIGAGAIGGMVWWLIADPGGKVWHALAVGAAIMALLLLASKLGFDV